MQRVVGSSLQEKIRCLRAIQRRLMITLDMNLGLLPNRDVRLGTCIAEEQCTHFSVSYGCGMSEHPLSSNLCTWSKFAIRCAAVPGEARLCARAQLEVNIRKTPDRGDAVIFLLHVREGNHKIRQTGLVCHCVVPSVAAATQRADGAARVVLYYKDYKLSLKTAVESSP